MVNLRAWIMDCSFAQQVLQRKPVVSMLQVLEGVTQGVPQSSMYQSGQKFVALVKLCPYFKKSEFSAQ